MATDNDKPSLLQQPAFVISAAFLLVVLALAAVMLVRGDDGSTEAVPQVPSSSPSRAGGAPGGGCNPTDTSQQIPTAAPPGVTWEVFNTVALPSSPTAGPMITQGGVARCYAHTPLGALLAAAQIPTRISLASDWQRVLTEQVLPSTGRDIFQRRRGQITTPLQFRPGDFAQTAGFRFVTYTADTAVVQLVTRNPDDGGLGVYTLTVMWRGDWKLQMRPDGSSNPPAQWVTSLEGFVAWGGV